MIYAMICYTYCFNERYGNEAGKTSLSELMMTKSSDAYCDDAIMGAMAFQITSLTIVYSTVYSDADQRKHESSASLAFVRGIQRGPVNRCGKWFSKIAQDNGVLVNWGLLSVSNPKKSSLQNALNTISQLLSKGHRYLIPMGLLKGFESNEN